MTAGALARPGGLFRRRIKLSRASDTFVSAWLEDDFHHFGVEIIHDGIVRDVRAITRRAPWSSCQGASIPLRALVGKPLIQRAAEVRDLIEMRVQCTHMFDLAGLALAHAARDDSDRTYDATVSDSVSAIQTDPMAPLGMQMATLMRDEIEVLSWTVDHETIEAPAAFARWPLGSGFRPLSDTLPSDEAEAAIILRRATMVARGRYARLDDYVTADATGMPPVCHSFSAPVRHMATRLTGSSQDFTDRPQALLCGDMEK